MNRNQITPEAALRILARLRADPSVLDRVRPLVADAATSLMAVDVEALSEAERTTWLISTRRLLGLADFLAFVDAPAPIFGPAAATSERTN